MSLISLKELSNEIITGTVVSRIESKNEEKIGTLKVLTLKSINSGKIDTEYIQTIDISKEATNNKLTRSGDIILKMNKPYDSVYIGKEYENFLIPSFCCLIRGIHEETVDPYYLVGYLNSSFAKDYLYASNSASAASLLKIRDIKQLPIPLPKLDEQNAIGEVFKICSERQLLLAKIMDHEMRLAENIVMDSVRKVLKHENKK